MQPTFRYFYLTFFRPNYSCAFHFQTDSVERKENNNPTSYLELTTVGDDNLGTCGSRGRTNSFDRLNNIHAFHDGTKDAVLAVQPGGLNGAQEELRTCMNSQITAAKRQRQKGTTVRRAFLLQ